MFDRRPQSGETSGNVLRIEKTSMYDGAGLRTVVFLKGCPLQCLWCSTPESQSPRTQVGYNREKCTLCGLCVAACTAKARRPEAEDARITRDGNRCTGCLTCVRTCPNSAVKGYGMYMTVRDVLREIEKDEVFYFHSGGGVTISGGEPLEQARFVEELLRGCQTLGIHRAMETSFFSPWKKIERILPYLSLLYVDLKHTDPAVHRRVTGVDNDIIMDNIRHAALSPYDFEMVVRIPVIPEINDADPTLENAARFIKSLDRVESVELLAYHRLGTETYRNLEMEYKLPDLASPSQDLMLKKARLIRDVSGASVIVDGKPVED